MDIDTTVRQIRRPSCRRAIEALEPRLLLAARFVKDINPAVQDTGPSNFVDVNGTLFFIADDGTHGPELWKSNGTAGGTALVKDINVFDDLDISFRSPELTHLNGTLFFAGDDRTNGPELWKSDGTGAGTVMLREFGILSDLGIGDFVDVNGTLFFRADDDTHGSEVWKSDGTPTGTVLIRDMNRSPLAGTDWSAGSDPEALTEMNGTVFFSADSGRHGVELWKTDGTKKRTVLIKDIRPGADGSSPFKLTSAGGILFFVAEDGIHGNELWKTDGTKKGTVMVRDLTPGPDGSNFNFLDDFLNVNGVLLFTADDGTHGRELWRSDGTKKGTVLVRNIAAGSDSTDFGSFEQMNGALFFRADDGTHGTQLWRSDGTKKSTVMLNGFGASYPTNVNGTLYFTAADGAHGAELWRSDGTKPGTTFVADIRSGTPSSFPEELLNVGDRLFFNADDGIHGRELWVFEA